MNHSGSVRISSLTQIVIGAILLLLVTIGVWSVNRHMATDLQRAVDLVDHTHDVETAILQTKAGLFQLSSAIRGAVIAPGPDNEREQAEGRRIVNDTLTELQKLTQDTPAQNRAIGEIRPLLDRYIRFASNPPRDGHAAFIDEAVTIRGQIDGILDGMSVAEQKLLSERSKNQARLLRNQQRLAGFLIFSLVLGVFTAALLISRAYKANVAATENLRHASETAHQATTAKSAFIANVTHELRTPLSAIMGYTDMLSEADVPAEKQSEIVGTIRQNCEHLLALINEVLDLSKIEAGKVEINLQTVDLQNLLREVLSVVRGRLYRKPVALYVEITGAVPNTFQADALRVRQILLNLLGNAIKFTPRGSIKVSLATSGRTLRIHVADTGIGMAEDTLGKIFVPFQQGSADLHSGGTGLGLALSRRFAQAMGGSLSVDSRLGIGSIFTLSLPLRNPSQETFEHFNDAVADSAKEHLAPSAQFVGKALLVEDSVDNQKIIEYYLRRFGLTVDTVDNGRAAVATALEALKRGKQYDVILMDIQLPELPGDAATEELRKNRYTAPIVALTANALEEDKRRCFRAGCNAFLTKPIDTERLEALLRQYLALAQDHILPVESTIEPTPQIEGLVRNFVKELPHRIEEIERAHEEGNLDRVASVAHMLAGAAGSYGYPDLSNMAVRLELEAQRQGDETPAIIESMKHAVRSVESTSRML